jgi:hypothetical protein
MKSAVGFPTGNHPPEQDASGGNRQTLPDITETPLDQLDLNTIQNPSQVENME